MSDVKIEGQVLGGYPRSRIVRRALRQYESGSYSLLDRERVLHSSALTVIGVQVGQGFPYVVDGMLDWHDIFRPYAEAWRNVTPTGLLRYFDNNFFYRIPLFTGEPEPTDPVLAPRVRSYAPIAEPSKLKVVIPGPVTFTLMSSNRTGVSDEELAEAIARLLAEEVSLAVEAGAGFVQIDEPILSDPKASKDHAALAAELSSMIASRAGGAKTMLSIYFYSPKPEVYEGVLETKVDYIMLDLVDAGGAALRLLERKGCPGHGVGLGVVNARNVYSDEYEAVKGLVEAAMKACQPEEVLLTTSTWLDLIPYKYSLRKTRLLGYYTHRIAGEMGALLALAGGE
ncbi:MAG: hypothetical protein F7C09_01190 [Aeropyrum sp.]|nr:hypothetical protein [Aeropyrum sp.]